MIRRLAAISGLVVLGALTLTTKANAQSVDVNFEGTLPNSCTITKNNDGILGMGPNEFTLEANANRGQVLVNCIGNGDVTVSVPIAESAAATDFIALPDTLYGAELWDQATGGTLLVQKLGGTPAGSVTPAAPDTTSVNPGDTTLYVNVFAESSGNVVAVPQGFYQFTTTVTVNPL